jgi:hypothetical protein
VIIKKIKNPKKSSPKAARIGNLFDYILNPEAINANEKCVYSGARGFITENQQSQKAEMLALSQEAVKSQDTINHYVMSWREGEQPSPSQIEEAISIFLRELDLEGHQVIYGLHADTDNLHLHIVVNRVHPETLKVIKPNKGFDIKAAHKAIALIEHQQGWQRELNGLYYVLENGELGREHENHDQPRKPEHIKQDMEQRTGEKSAERIAIEVGAPIIRQAKSWQALHQALSAEGLRYEKKGSGGMIFVGDVGVKPSQVDRTASFPHLQKRLGLYESPSIPLSVVTRAPEPIKDVPGWATYIAGRKKHYADKAMAINEQRTRHEAERHSLFAQQKAQREVILKGDWKGRGDLLNGMRSVLAAEQAAEKAALKERHQYEREQLRPMYPAYPDLEQWLLIQQSPEAANAWRYRESEPQRTCGDKDEPAMPRDIRAYQSAIYGQQVHYTRKDTVGQSPHPSFVDKGREIDIHDWRSSDTVLAALQLSAQKWGSFTVAGNDEYKTMCVKLAAEHGFKINNPELQESIQAERQRIQQERAQAMKSESLRQFEQYHDAVGAERYRVTSIKMRAGGDKQTFILDKKDGITQGFTSHEVERRMPEMQRLQRRGEHLYYTPLSDKKHHLLIDDMNREKLELLIRDGYSPAVVLESSPGNYQAIITVQKLGSPYDREVGNRLAERLNRQYGDPTLSGCIHPHRAPGFENRKPQHLATDGSYPTVKLLKAEHQECVMTLALSSHIDAEYRLQSEQKPQRPERKPHSAADMPTAGGNAVTAYQRHRNDILKRQEGGAIDLSRVDSMIAIRMRVTGHSQAEIEGTIRQCAPAARQAEEGRDWAGYARRTAGFAFSVAGERQSDHLWKYKQQWEKLEDRTLLDRKRLAERQIENDEPGMGR